MHRVPLRTITRPDDGLHKRVRAHLATRRAKRSLRRRGYWVETANTELKEHHSLRQAPYRGRVMVQIQAYDAAITYNIKKLLARIAVDYAGQATTSASGPAALSSLAHADRCRPVFQRLVPCHV